MFETLSSTIVCILLGLVSVSDSPALGPYIFNLNNKNNENVGFMKYHALFLPDRG